jgi:hypothetical protein
MACIQQPLSHGKTHVSQTNKTDRRRWQLCWRIALAAHNGFSRTISSALAWTIWWMGAMTRNASNSQWGWVISVIVHGGFGMEQRIALDHVQAGKVNFSI